MRKACLQTIHKMAVADERIVFVGSDLTRGVLEPYRDEVPDRFFMEGVSEAHLVGMAAGLASTGRIPYVTTIATFLTRRCLEQIAMDACLHRYPVRLVAFGGGMVYAPLGPTHNAMDDIALLRALPNMTILVPADAVEMKALTLQTADWPGPVYIRIAKGGDPIVTTGEGVQIGRAVRVQQGRDVLLVTTGTMLQLALQAARLLEDQGVEVGILHMHTVKPLDVEALLEEAASAAVVLTVEEHSQVGGLGSAVAEVLAEVDWVRRPRFARVALPDAYLDKYGSQAEILGHCGITPEHLQQRAAGLLASQRASMVAT
jgi:transketolase